MASNQEPADPLAVDSYSAAVEAAYFSNKRTFSDHPSPSPLRRRPPERKSGPRDLPSDHGTSQDGGVRNRRRVDRFSGLAPQPCRANCKLRHPSVIFGGCIVYCRTTAEVEQAALDLLDKIRDLKQNEDRISLGFDIEWRPVFTRGKAPNRAAVMQLCVDTTHCYVLHIIHSGIPPSLKFLLEDFSSVKLAKPRKIRMGNWEAIPLSEEKLQYAATDAFISWHLYQVLMSFPDCKPDNENEERE